jgi:hypothetical protein
VSVQIENIRRAVEAMHECKARHEYSAYLTEMFGFHKVWEGVVESFSLEGHQLADRCYAWGFKHHGEVRYVAVLELPPINSPTTAVRAAVAGGQQKQNH